jgi:glycosyltransferase involved in cell wall biosynthesis
MIIGVDGSRSFIGKRTGTENYSYQLLKHLAEIDTENRYKVFLRPDNELVQANWPGNFEFKLINFKRLWTQMGLSLETFKTKMDLLFVPSHTLPVVNKPGLKTIMVVHDLGVEYLPSMHQLKQRLYLGWITHHQLQSASHLIAVSMATKNDLIQRLGIPEEKITVVYEGVDKNTYRPVRTETVNSKLKDYNLKKQSYYIYISTIQPRKNLLRLMQAFSIYLKKHDKGEQLILIGKKGWLSDEIYQYPKELGLEKRIVFLGYVPTDDVVALLNGAKALVYPSLFEGFGLPILEAYACNCPVLTSNVSSMPEVAGKGAVLVDPENIKEIADGLEQFNNLEKRQHLIEEGQKQLQKFSWQRCAKETLAVLEEVYKRR